MKWFWYYGAIDLPEVSKHLDVCQLSMYLLVCCLPWNSWFFLNLLHRQLFFSSVVNLKQAYLQMQLKRGCGHREIYVRTKRLVQWQNVKYLCKSRITLHRKILYQPWPITHLECHALHTWKLKQMPGCKETTAIPCNLCEIFPTTFWSVCYLWIEKTPCEKGNKLHSNDHFVVIPYYSLLIILLI